MWVVVGWCGVVVAAAAPSPLVLDTFDAGKNVNALGGPTGAWYDPDDPSVGCTAVFETTAPFGGSGASLRLDYNIASVRERVQPNRFSDANADGRTTTPSLTGRAFNGYYSVFPPRDLSAYRVLVFWVRGDPARGYPRSFKIEIKDGQVSSPRLIEGVTPRWRRVVVPLSAFREIKDWTSIKEFVVVFSEDSVNRPSGSIYLDDVYFAGNPKDNIKQVSGGKP
jgi:hypothetical protein